MSKGYFKNYILKAKGSVLLNSFRGMVVQAGDAESARKVAFEYAKSARDPDAHLLLSPDEYTCKRLHPGRRAVVILADQKET